MVDGSAGSAVGERSLRVGDHRREIVAEVGAQHRERRGRETRLHDGPLVREVEDDRRSDAISAAGEVAHRGDRDRAQPGPADRRRVTTSVVVPLRLIATTRS